MALMVDDASETEPGEVLDDDKAEDEVDAAGRPGRLRRNNPFRRQRKYFVENSGRVESIACKYIASIFTSVGTTRGHGDISVLVVALFLTFSLF